MKRNLIFSIVGLTLGLVSGFRVANYTYRAELETGRIAALSPGSGASKDAQPNIAQVQAVVAKARSNTQDFDAQHEAAHLYTQIQQPEGAIEFLIKAQQIRPKDPETLAELAEAYYFSQKFDEAITWARRGLAENPSFPIANYYLMVSLLEGNKNLDEAERILGELEKLRPGDQALAEIRQVLIKAKGATGNSKSVLSHGPQPETGGKR